MSALRDLTVTANGLRHHLVEHPGDGRGAVLLLHGYLDLARSFEPVIERLGARGHRVVALDFRGHGDSDRCPPGSYYHFPDYLADVVAVLDALGLARAHVAAHSMGASVATMLAGALPTRVRSLALLDGVGPPAMPAEIVPDRTARWLEGLAKTRAKGPRRMATLDDVVARMRLSHPEVPASALRAAAAVAVRPEGDGWVFRFDPLHQTISPGRFDAAGFEAYIDRVACPTLIVTGSELADFDELAQRAARYPRAERAHLAGAGHMLHWTAPAALADAVGDFLAAVESREGEAATAG
jgi:pimeloyl-ACP methyl ester carboxylesterase